MTRRRPRAFCAALLLAAVAGLTPAQVPWRPPEPQPARIVPIAPPPLPDDNTTDDDDDVQLSTNLVLVTAVVTKSGNDRKFIRDLTAADFTVLDEGVPQEVAFFGDEEIPLDVVFLFDASQSTLFRQRFQREALTTFLRTLLRPTDSAAILYFNNKVFVEQDFTSQPGSLLAAIDRIPQGGATALYAGVAAASGRISERKGRRALVILSDGRDTFSDLRLEHALEAAQRADTVIYALNTSYAGWAVTPEYKRNDPLEYLASETGGEVYYISNPDEVETALSRLTGRLRERYMLGFYPSATGSGPNFHRLVVRVNRKDTRVETRRGYYAH